MIPIKINDKKYKIKTIDELTAREFIELTSFENLDMIKYIAWQTGLDSKDTFFAVISPTVEKAIGTIPDIRKMKLPKWIEKENIIETVGQRHQVEGSNLKGYDLLVHTLAVANAKTPDDTEVSELKEKYYEMLFSEVLPAGFFFFKNYKNGKKPGQKILRWLMGLMKIRN